MTLHMPSHLPFPLVSVGLDLGEPSIPCTKAHCLSYLILPSPLPVASLGGTSLSLAHSSAELPCHAPEGAPVVRCARRAAFVSYSVLSVFSPHTAIPAATHINLLLCIRNLYLYNSF